MQTSDIAKRLIKHIYELSDGDTDQVIRRKNLGGPLGLSGKETKDALKELTKAGMIRYIIFRSLAITHVGVAEAKRLKRETPTPAAVESGVRSATASGSGTIAQEDGVAAGAGGVAVGGDVHGPVIIAGEGTHITMTTQDDGSRDQESDTDSG